jgi:hypothetical protein
MVADVEVLLVLQLWYLVFSENIGWYQRGRGGPAANVWWWMGVVLFLKAASPASLVVARTAPQ